MAGGGQVVFPQPRGCRNGAVMDWADFFPGSATIAELSVPNLWHGKAGLARSCILFFPMREMKGKVKRERLKGCAEESHPENWRCSQTSHITNVKPHPLCPVPGVSLRAELDYAFYKDIHDSLRDPK